MRFAYIFFAVLVFSNIHAQNKIDAIPKPPPAPTDVNVLNFPDVQAVGGTVNVGNLPLDTDGALRVTSAPARQPVVLELLTQPMVITSGGQNILGTVDTGGFSSIQYFAMVENGNACYTSPRWRWSDDEPFGSVSDFRFSNTAPPCSFFVLDNTSRVTCTVGGSQLEVRAQPVSGSTATVTAFRVYLFP